MNTESFKELISLLPDEARAGMLPPATNHQITQASAAIGKRLVATELPAEIVAIYQTCGGQKWETPTEHYLFPLFTLNPIDRAISDYDEISDNYEINILADLPDGEETEKFPNTWYDFRLFPFGTSFGTGTSYCMALHTAQIFSFHPDGGIWRCEYDSISELIYKSIEFQRKEYGR